MTSTWTPPTDGSDFDTDLCTIDVCSLEYANFTYIPSLGGNIAYATIFGLLLVAQLFMGIRSRTWTFLGGMFGGLVLEIIGYVGRVQLHYNPFPFIPFVQ